MIRFESIIICDGAEMLKQDTFLGALPNATGEVEISMARLASNGRHMVGHASDVLVRASMCLLSGCDAELCVKLV